jgi:hypothetical protein
VRRIDTGGSLGIDLNLFAMHGVLFQPIYADRPEGVQTDVQRDESGIDTPFSQLSK